MTNHKSYYQKLLAVFLLTILIGSFPRSLFAAAPTSKWSKRLGYPNSAYIRSISMGSERVVVTMADSDALLDLNGDEDSNDSAENNAGFGSLDILVSVFDYTGTFQWAKRLGGTGLDNTPSAIVDGNGNIIVVGSVTGDADLNNDGDKTDTGESATGYGSNDRFITVFNSSGTHQWSKRLGSTSGDSALKVKADSNNNLVLYGEIPAASFDLNGDGDFTDSGESAVGYGSDDIGVTVFNSAGVNQWTKRLGTTTSDSLQNIEIAPNNNIVIAAILSGNADLNGDGDMSDSNETATGTAAISVFNSSGTHQWAERIGMQNNFAIDVDSNGNIAYSGSVTGARDLTGDDDTNDNNGESATGYGSTDWVISVFDSSGSYQWSKRLGSTGLDTSDNFSLSTQYTSENKLTVNFYNQGAATDLNGDGDSTDGGAEDVNSSYLNFISVFNSDGTHAWAKRFGDTPRTYAPTYFYNTELLIAGYNSSAFDINGDQDILDTAETNLGSEDGFLSVFSGSGVHQWARRIGGTDDDNVEYIATDSDGRIAASGYTASNADLNGDGDFLDGGEVYAADYTGFISFWSPDVTSPSASSITSTAAADVTIAWTTNEASSSQVEYGTTTSYGTTTIEADTSPRVTSHSVTLTGLATCTTYHYRAKSTDAEGNTTTGSDSEFKTSGCPAQQAAPGDDAPQVSLGSSGSNASGGALSPIRDSNTQGQKASVILSPNTLTMNAFLSSQASIPSSGNSLFVNPITGQSILNKNANMVFAGNILGIRSGSCISWQVGRVQKMWFKAYPPKGSSSSPAAIIPELQLKSSIISLGYNDLDLIPPGNKANSFREGSLKLAHSLDGSNWKLLPSVVDQVNNSVATIGKVGGYYAIVSSCGGVAPANTGTLGVSTKYIPQKTKVVKPIKKTAPKVIKKTIKKQPKP